MGKSSINGPFSMAMLNNQRVYMFFHAFPIDCFGCIDICIYIYYMVFAQHLGKHTSLTKSEMRDDSALIGEHPGFSRESMGKMKIQICQIYTIFYDFPSSWECHHPNWRTHIFQRGWLKPPTRDIIYIYIYLGPGYQGFDTKPGDSSEVRVFRQISLFGCS